MIYGSHLQVLQICYPHPTSRFLNSRHFYCHLFLVVCRNFNNNSSAERIEQLMNRVSMKRCSSVDHLLLLSRAKLLDVVLTMTSNIGNEFLVSLTSGLFGHCRLKGGVRKIRVFLYRKYYLNV
jgi:hypothetical protein